MRAAASAEALHVLLPGRHCLECPFFAASQVWLLLCMYGSYVSHHHPGALWVPLVPCMQPLSAPPEARSWR